MKCSISADASTILMLRENSRREKIKIYKSQRTRTTAVMS